MSAISQEFLQKPPELMVKATRLFIGSIKK